MSVTPTMSKTMVGRVWRFLVRRLTQWVNRIRLLVYAQRKDVLATKIFCVGRNKTGTTSLEHFFRSAGFRVAPQAKAEALIYKCQFEPDDRFWAWIEKYEVFQDAPFSWSWFFSLLVERYPDARFILSVRDERDWYVSYVEDQLKHLGLSRDASEADILAAISTDSYIAPGYRMAVMQKIYGEDNIVAPLMGPQRAIDDYHQHNQLVRNTLMVGQLLEINLSEHASTYVLCEFLGLPKRFEGEMPRANVNRPQL